MSITRIVGYDGGSVIVEEREFMYVVGLLLL